MGRQIVYCGSCGRSLREEEFSQGRAQYLDHQPFCADCRPIPETPRRGTDRIPKVASSANRKTSTARIPVLTPSTRRSAAPRKKRKSAVPMILGGAAVAAFGVVILAIAVETDSPPSMTPEARPVAAAPAPPSAPEPVVRDAVPRPRRARSAEDVAAELKAFAETEKDPTAILLRCEAARGTLAGTPHEALLREVETRAMAAKKASKGIGQIAAALETVRTIRISDPGFERSDEVLGLLRAALKVAGSDRGKVEKEIAAYEKCLEQARKARVTVPAPKPRPGSAPLRIESLTLVRAPDGSPVEGFDPIPDGGVLTFSESTGRKFNIVANLPAGMKPGSIRFHLQGGKTMIENSAPFAYLGNTGETYKIWKPTPGTYRISARPFQKSGAKGASGPAISIEFSIVESSTGPN